MEISNKILSDITVYMKYSKFIPEKNRRETWEEIVGRNKNMHIKSYPNLEEEIEEAYKLVLDKKVLPSMRSMQFAGKPIEISPNRIYNCGFVPMDDWRAFHEIMFLLLGGTGIGYSVQRHHIEQLPEIRKPNMKRNRRFLIGDSIEGWADAIKVLMKSYFQGGSNVLFDFSDIRPKGARLVTSGGKAPGPQPLKECIIKVRGILDHKEEGDQLTSIEVHDIVCHIADAVLAGGIRRAALISLFSADDEEMIAAKAGHWWELNPQRGRANNSAVLVRSKIDEEYFMELWERIKASGSGEPGVFFTNDKDWGTNPSLRAGTKVYTTGGIFNIEDLQDREFFVKNLNGEVSKAKCWLSGKNKKLYKLNLAGGQSYYATAEHEWAVYDGEKYIKVKTPDIEGGSLLPIIKQDKLFDGNIGTYEDGFFIGWQLGDGWKIVRSDNGLIQHGLIVSGKDAESGVGESLISYLRENIGSDANFSSRDGNLELNTINNNWNSLHEKFGVGFKSDGLPSAVWRSGTEEFRRGIIDAIFSSDGHVEKGKKRISLTSCHNKLIDDVSELLGFYGIKSSVICGKSQLNGNEYDRYTLRITDGYSIRHFRKLFRLSVKYKQDMLDSYEFPYNLASDKIEVVSVEETDIFEDVWDISVFDETHCFLLSKCVTGNCCEIALRPNQMCNLTEVNVSNVESQEDLNERVSAAAFIGTLQAGYTDFHYLRPVWQRTTEKDALIGVSMTGIASKKVFDLDLKEAAKIVKKTNKETAEKIGVKPAARTTCVKPAGTTSLTLGTSSGIHAWHNDYYIRRIRVGKNESIYKYLSVNHPELIEDEFFSPHDTAVISVPQKAPDGSITRQESALDLLQRVKEVNQSWIKPGHGKGMNTHNISATITVKPEEWDDVGFWMWENRDVYNGLSVLPFSDHSYRQAPFEDCDREDYERMMEHLRNIDLSKVVEVEDDTDLKMELACSGGSSCEIV